MATERDYRRELLVWGYIRQLEKIHNDMNIPIEINDIIYLFQRIYDQWDKKYSNEHIMIDQEKSMITFNAPNNHEFVTAFGSHSVSKGIFKWKIKLLSFVNNGLHGGSPFVGIIEDKEELVQSSQSGDWDGYGYQFCGGSGNLYSEWAYRENKAIDYGCKWKEEGDVIEMILDLDDYTLSFSVNGEGFGVAFKNIMDTNYRLVLSAFNCKGSQFGMLE